MKIKTCELSGVALDWVVAKCEYDELAALNIQYPKQAKFYPKYQPSLDWSQGGPIIERERIRLGHDNNGEYAILVDDNGVCCLYGNTPLIAAMRCFVASKIGGVVDVPGELIGE